MLLLLAACGGGDDTGAGNADPYVIGFQGPLSGPLGPIFGPAEDGMTDYFEYLNEQGGVNGRPVEFRSTDAGTEVARALAATREFSLDDDVLLVTGLGLSVQMVSVLPMLEEEELPGISITSSLAEALPYSRWYFSWGDDLPGSANSTLDFILGEKPDAKIGYMAYDTPLIRAQRDAVRSRIEQSDATLVADHLPPATATDVSAEMRDLIDKGAEYIFFGGATAGIFSSAMTTAQVAGFGGTIVVAAAGGDVAEFELAGSETYEYVGARYFHSPMEEDHAGVQKMLQLSGASPTSFYYTSGWSLAQYIGKALEGCGADCDRARLRDALEQVPPENPDDLAGGPLGFDDKCHQGHRSTMFFRWDAQSKKPVYDTTLPYWSDPSHPCARE
ncbi:ABC transporter substrate-binding protein [Pseudonocardia nigra]|uniref:ABC transporter substrate-binding protein n=1 Tax=Pseudonocardia nigra TaxID=1921578 RepID=UPI001FE87C58|nr:ABC transporter substrate-binding protein [Pseudonocardia nigra]